MAAAEDGIGILIVGMALHTRQHHASSESMVQTGYEEDIKLRGTLQSALVPARGRLSKAHSFKTAH